MRPQLIASISAVLTALFISCTPLSAVADNGDPNVSCPPGTVSSPQAGWICVPVSDPGTPGGSNDGGGSKGGDKPAAACKGGGKSIPCSLNGDSWFSSGGNSHEGCYATQMTPQPPEQDPYWPTGKGPKDGVIYWCEYHADGTDYFGPGAVFFVPQGQATPPPPDPAQMARDLLKTMPLVKPTVHIAPTPPKMTYVGLDTWLWIDDAQWRNVSANATIRTTTVTVVARPVQVSWDLGDGTKNCGSGGRAWVDGMSSSAKTDCSYQFQHVSDFEPNKTFGVNATINYQVDWTCAGLCIQDAGTLGQVPGFTSATTPIRVGERQSVVVG